MNLLQRKPKAPDTRPRGIIKVKDTYSEFLYGKKKQEGIAEIREIEKIDDLSHVEIIKITGISLAVKPEELLPAWLPSSQITWVDGGEQ